MRIVWLDLETTGLSTNLPNESILEIAAIVTEGPKLAEVARWHSLALPKLEHWQKMHANVVQMHKESGLTAELAAGAPAGKKLRSAADLDAELSIWLLNNTQATRCYLGGSNPDFDRAFLRVYMPNAEKKLHYRNLDVNSLFIIRELVAGKEKTGTKHRAMADCEQAIQGYRDHFAWMARVFGEKK